MTDNECKAVKMIQMKNMVLIVSVVILVLGLFYLSNSWISLLGGIGFLFQTKVETD